MRLQYVLLFFIVLFGVLGNLPAQSLPGAVPAAAIDLPASAPATSPADTPPGGDAAPGLSNPLILPLIRPAPKPGSGPLLGLEPERQGVDWNGVIGQSLFLLSIENAFRCATERGTRDGFSLPFWRWTANSITNLHGWADGDEFYVNYVGHPMQGAVTGFLWNQNDRRYRTAEFGANKRYWKSRLRSAAFAWAYSTAFEVGPLSEATLGHIQAFWPQQGFVDHAVTPTVGLGWMIGEDALDQYVVRFIERRTDSRYLRLLARGGLNPARTMANALRFKAPWHRDDRPGIRVYHPHDDAFVTALKERHTSRREVSPPPGVAPFEFAMDPKFRTYVGDGAQGSCMGGGGSVALRLASEWQLVLDVSGCKMLGLEKNLSGDSLSYLIGPRWTASPAGRWTPHAQVLLGGNKLTQERMYPEQKALLQQIAKLKDLPPPTHEDYTRQYETNGFSLEAGAGLKYRVNNAIAFHVAKLDYTKSWVSPLNGYNYSNGLQFSSGLVVQMGTW